MHRRMKWRLAMKIAKKAAEWNPGLSTMHPTNRPVGRPKKRLEHETNDFSSQKKVKVAKNRERWKAMESEYAASVESVRSRRNSPQDPVRPTHYERGEVGEI